MPRFTASVTSSAALANGQVFAALVPAAAANFKVLSVQAFVVNAVGAITDADLAIGVNRGTARGTQTATTTGERLDPNSAASAITGMDTTWSVQPTLAAADGRLVGLNTRGGYAAVFDETAIVSNVGTANPICFVQRSGGALPASHSIILTVTWFE